MPESFRPSELLEIAAKLLGSDVELRTQMKWSAADLAAYRAGKTNLPWTEYDRLVALIIREQGKLLEKNKQLLRALGKGTKPRDD